jgi:hypothetical protein
VIETGQYSVNNTKYVFRVRNGVYRVHPQAIADQVKLNEQRRKDIEEPCGLYVIGGYFGQALTGSYGLAA